MSIVHHHLLYYANVGEKKQKVELENMLIDLADKIDMQIIIPPRVALSHQEAYTGLMGIVTSHISFHYWQKEEYVQMDIYSCKPFDKDKAKKYLNNFWKASNDKTLFIDREKKFKIELD